MSRLSANILVLIATGCGVMTAYATWQPEFEKQAAERNGDFSHQHVQDPDANEKALSRAIASDFKEAGEQFRDTSKGGFAWGIRQMIAGKVNTSPSGHSSAANQEAAEAKK